MSLSSLNTDAFVELVRFGSFSKAAKNLFITQSALSQRIKNLEKALGASLVIRGPSGIRLTSSGEVLLRYCRARAELENECEVMIRDPKAGALSGALRIAGFSTIMRSVVLPSVADFAKGSPDIGVELFVREMNDLPHMLRSGEADYIFLDHELNRSGIESEFVGNEVNVVIRSKHKKCPDDVFIDHDPDDRTTLNFLKAQRKNTQAVKRIFLDEIYSIIDGVTLPLLGSNPAQRPF